jgi:FkbM family methyltransferase
MYLAAALDVGAHIGTHSIGLALAVGSSGKVMAFEPQRGLHDVLVANAALTGLGNVEALRLAVGGCPAPTRSPASTVAGDSLSPQAGTPGPTGRVPGPRPRVPIPIVDVVSVTNATIPFWEHVTGAKPSEDSSQNYGGVSIVDLQRLLNTNGTASANGTGAEGHGDPHGSPDATAGPGKDRDHVGDSEWVEWVESVCLDELPWPKCPRLLKMDCEGMESQVLTSICLLAVLVE